MSELKSYAQEKIDEREAFNDALEVISTIYSLSLVPNLAKTKSLVISLFIFSLISDTCFSTSNLSLNAYLSSIFSCA